MFGSAGGQRSGQQLAAGSRMVSEWHGFSLCWQGPCSATGAGAGPITLLIGHQCRHDGNKGTARCPCRSLAVLQLASFPVEGDGAEALGGLAGGATVVALPQLAQGRPSTGGAGWGQPASGQSTKALVRIRRGAAPGRLADQVAVEQQIQIQGQRRELLGVRPRPWANSMALSRGGTGWRGELGPGPHHQVVEGRPLKPTARSRTPGKPATRQTRRAGHRGRPGYGVPDRCSIPG